MRGKIISFALGLLAALAVVHSSPAAADRGDAAPCRQLPAARPTWEYSAVRGTKDKPFKLNDAGAQGWELVAVTQDGGGTSFFFKRLRAD